MPFTKYSCSFMQTRTFLIPLFISPDKVDSLKISVPYCIFGIWGTWNPWAIISKDHLLYCGIEICMGLYSLSGIAMPQAGLCFADVTWFLNVAPSHSTTGGRIATRIVALRPSMKNYYGYKFGELRSNNSRDLTALLYGKWLHVGWNKLCAGY